MNNFAYLLLWSCPAQNMALLQFLSVIVCIFFVTLGMADGDSFTSSESSNDKPALVTKRISFTSPNRKSLTAKKGSTLRLECEFRSQPWSLIQWVKVQISESVGHSVIPVNETITGASSTISAIVLENVERQDTGNYTCVSANALGATSFDFTLYVKEKLVCGGITCSSRGVCQEAFDSSLCICDEGYMGKDCEKEDPCFASPCLNNGSCTVLDDDGYNCTCTEEFGGENCQLEVCTATSCNGGGSCSNTDDGNIKCTCNNDRAGNRCQHRCDFVRARRSSWCNGYTCVINDQTGLQRCECNQRSSRSRNYCMMRSDVKSECQNSSICNGYGTCYEQTYEYYCECHSYRHGKHCEFYNECSRQQNNICSRNGANCVDLPVGYKCTNCPRGQFGDKCQFKKDPCTTQCYQNRMRAECDMRFLDQRLQAASIYLNSKACIFNRNEQTGYYSRHQSNYYRRSMDIDFTSCGTEIEYGEDHIIYRNTLRLGTPHLNEEKFGSVITRNSGYFQFKMECKMPLKQPSAAAQLSDLTLPLNLTTSLEDAKNISISSIVTLYRDSGYGNTATNYVAGERLYAMIYIRSLENTILQTDGQILPDTCYASNTNAEGGVKYYLLERGCIKDESFRIEANPNSRYSSRSYYFFSFNSFTFKDDPGKLYLTCISRYCLTNRGTCKLECASDPKPTTLPLSLAETTMAQSIALVETEAAEED